MIINEKFKDLLIGKNIMQIKLIRNKLIKILFAFKQNCS